MPIIIGLNGDFTFENYVCNLRLFCYYFQDYLDYHRSGDAYSDSSNSDSDIFPTSYIINIRDLNIDLSRKPDPEQMNGEMMDIIGDEVDPKRAYQEYKNYHRNLVRSSSSSSFDSLNSLSVDNEYTDYTAPVGKVSYASQNKPSRSGANKPSTSATRPEEYEVVVISDDDDEEPFLDLTTTPDDEPVLKRPALPLVCDLTEDGNYDIFINEEAASPAYTPTPGSVGSQKKVQEWLEAGQGEPNRAFTKIGGVQGEEYVAKIVPQHASLQNSQTAIHSGLKFAQTALANTMRPIMTQDIRKMMGDSNTVTATTNRTAPMMTKDVMKIMEDTPQVPVARVLPMAQPKADGSAHLPTVAPSSIANASSSSAPNTQPVPQQTSSTTTHAKCTCNMHRTTAVNLPNVSGVPQSNTPQQQFNPSCKIQSQAYSTSASASTPTVRDSNSQTRKPIDDTVIILD